MLLIGSLAARSHGVSLGREPKDIDFITTWEDFQLYAKAVKRDHKGSQIYPLSGNKWVIKDPTCGLIEEFEIAWPSSTGEELMKIEGDCTAASLEALLALKLSHRYLKNSPAFLKTMKDIWVLRARGIEVPDSLKDWLTRREKETLNYGHPKLNQSKMGFFDKSVNYKYDHDSIHRAVAYRTVPAYTKYKGDNAEVFCNRAKFEGLSLLERLEGVAEEAYVLALERSLIPYPGAMSPKKAFDFALMKVCTSITSGWFREFAWENYELVQAIYTDNYVDKFRVALFEGEIPLAQ